MEERAQGGLVRPVGGMAPHSHEEARMEERAQGGSARPLGCWHHIVTKKQGWKNMPVYSQYSCGMKGRL